jgi:hypothetical protein
VTESVALAARVERVGSAGEDLIEVLCGLLPPVAALAEFVPVPAIQAGISNSHGAHRCLARRPHELGARHRCAEEVARLHRSAEPITGEPSRGLAVQLHQELRRPVLGHSIRGLRDRSPLPLTLGLDLHAVLPDRGRRGKLH